MNSRHLVDPDLKPLLDTLPTMEITAELLPLIRAGNLPLHSLGDYSASTISTRSSVPGPEGAPDVEVMITAPAMRRPRMPAILHIHGGGYVAGRTQNEEANQRALASLTDCIIISVEYRLAPETPFPGAIEDCYAALAWVFAESNALGVDTSHLGVMGESAGGGLAAALALLARDRGQYPLAFQHLIYPMLDDRTCTAANPHPYAGEFVWNANSNVLGWTSLLGRAPGAADVSPYAAAARATDLTGLPPAFISTGALDLFLEEDLEYGRRLLRAGVPVELHVYPGAYHGFDLLTDATVARNARRDSQAALRRFLHGTA